MQTEEGEETSSLTMMMDPWSLFLYGMKAPMTREKYRGRLAECDLQTSWPSGRRRPSISQIP